MAQHGWTILCTRAPITEGTGNISLMDLIDEVQIGVAAAPEQPLAIAVGWTLVTLWRRSDRAIAETIRQRLTFRGPNGLEGQPWELDVALDTVRVRAIANISILPFLASGMYEFVVSHRELPDGAWVEDSIVPVDVLVTAGAQ